MTRFPNYCSTCGSELEIREIAGRRRAYCVDCGRPRYRNAKPCSGVIVTDRSEVLFVKRTNPPAVGSWSLPAGFLEIDERPADAAVRELAEETGLSASSEDLSLFDTNLVKHDDGRYVLVIIYRTTAAATDGTVTAGSDAAEARFWNLSELSDANEEIEPGYEPILRNAVYPE